MFEEVLILLGDSIVNYSEDLIGLILKQTIAEVEGYTKVSIVDDYELENIVERLTIIKLNRINTEGLSGMSMGGVSENYIDGYPADILAVLNRKRKIKVI